MAQGPAKSDRAFRTIGELADELGLPKHILRYWETRFPQLRPLQRAGNRRYYRPEDVALAHHIHQLLNREGYTIRGAQKLLAQGRTTVAATIATASPTEENSIAQRPAGTSQNTDFPAEQLQAIRASLVEALAQ